MHEKKAVGLSSSTAPTSSAEGQSFRSRSLSPTFLPPHTNETKNSSWFLSPSSQIGSLCSSQNVMSFLPESLSPEKLHQKDKSIIETKEGHHHQKSSESAADLSSSAVENVPSRVSTSGQLPVGEKAQRPNILKPLSRGEKNPLQEKSHSSSGTTVLGGSLAAGVKSSLQSKAAAGSQSVSLSRSVGRSKTGRHGGHTSGNSHMAAKFVAASKTSTKPVRSRKRSPQGLSPLLSSRFPVNAPSFVIPQIPAMPSHDIGTYFPAAGSMCNTSLKGNTGFSRVSASSTYFPDLPAAIHQPKSVIGYTPQSSSVIGHTPYSISVMAHSSQSSAASRTPQSSTIGHALSSIQKRYQNSTVSKGTSGVQSPDGKSRRISVASPPLTAGIGLRRSRSSSTSSSALSSPSPPPAEMCIAGEPRVSPMPSKHKSTVHHIGCLDSGEYLSKKHMTIPLFQPKTLLGNNSSSIFPPSVSPSIVTVMSASSKPSHSVMPSHSVLSGSLPYGVADIRQAAETSAARIGKSGAKGGKHSRKTSVSSLKSDTYSFSPPSLHDPPRPMVVSSPTKYLSEATEIKLPSPSQYTTNQYSPNGAFVTPFSPHISSPVHGVQSEVLNTSPMAPPFGFSVAHGSGAASPSSVASSSGNPSAAQPVDLSKMSRWEIEQLYYYNTAILEEQKRLMKVIEKHLLETEQESNVRKPSTFEMYKNFLEFLTEPDTIPDASIDMYGFSEESEVSDVIVGGTPYQPIINSKYDVYRKFLNKT